MFVLAHLSDPHLAPLPTPRPRELAGKRLLGYVNWRRNRHKVHRTEQVDMLVRDLKSRAPDHVAVTGDLVNIALEAEFAQARAWLHGLGSPHDVTLVPGHGPVHGLNWLGGPRGAIPAVGVPAASATVTDRKGSDCAAYNLYRIGGTARAYSCEAVTRGFRAGADRIVELGRSEVKLAAQM